MADGVMAAMAALAATRHGVVGVAEATELGVSRSRLRTAVTRGDWKRPMHGVLVAASAPVTWWQLAAIAVVASGGWLSHRAAGRLHRLDGCDDAAVEVTVPIARTWRSDGVVVHRSARLDPPDLLEVDGIRVTSIARTLVDLGSVADDDLVEQALDDALRRGASERWIDQTLDRLRRPGPTGVGELDRVLARPDRAGPLPDSVFERLIERACLDAGLPQPERQIRVADRDDRLVATIDAGWTDRRLGIEGHSQRWHAGARRGRRDLARDNELAALGWELLYASWAAVEDPTDFIRQLRDAYDLRSPRTDD